jgi:hypothetical protein
MTNVIGPIRLLNTAEANDVTSGWIDIRNCALARVWVKAADKGGTAAATVTIAGAVDADGTASATLATLAFTAAGVKVWDENTGVHFIKLTTSGITTATVNAWLTGKG